MWRQDSFLRHGTICCGQGSNPSFDLLSRLNSDSLRNVEVPGRAKSAANSRGIIVLNGAGCSRLTDLTLPEIFCPMFIPLWPRLLLELRMAALYETRNRSTSNLFNTTRGVDNVVDEAPELNGGRRRSLDLSTGPRLLLILERDKNKKHR